jgi:hypothetical protein
MAEEEDSVLDAKDTGDLEPTQSDEPGTKKPTPFKVKVKKYWSTKTAGTSMGRALIVQSLGPNGEEIFNHLGSALARHYGDAKAEQIRTDLLKIALKTKILFDENYLNPQSLATADKPFRDFCFQAVKDLNSEVQTPGKVDATEMIKTMQTLKTAVLAIYEPLIKAKNLQKLEGLFLHLGEEEFLRQVLNERAFAETRNVLRKGLEPMAALLEKFDEAAVSKQRQLCKSWNCPAYEIKSKGLFRGMGYCAKHHSERFGPIVSEPQLKMFLEHKFLTVQLVDFLQNKLLRVLAPSGSQESKSETFDDVLKEIRFEAVPSNEVAVFRSSFYGAPVENPSPLLLHYYYFHEAVKQFEQIGSKALRTSRVNQIEKKFLNPTSSARFVWLPSDVRSEIFQAISDSRVSKSLFDKADQFSLGVLDKIFSEFIKTVYYERAVVSVTLPPDVEIQAGDAAAAGRVSIYKHEEKKE